MRSLILVTFAFFCAANAQAEQLCTSSPCITVDIYYESLCPDSVRFINHQLVPSYNGLKDHLKINFVPYGKASHRRDSTGKWTFTCQHGRAECRGNKAQACAIDAILNLQGVTFETKQSMSVKLVGCVMSSRYPADAVAECARTVELSPETRNSIDNCMRTANGDFLLATHGDKTHELRPRLSFVPTIVIDKVYTVPNQNGALVNFKKLICDRIPAGGRPSICAQ